MVPAEPMTFRIDAAMELTGISRLKLYELIQAGRLGTIKVGRWLVNSQEIRESGVTALRKFLSEPSR